MEDARMKRLRLVDKVLNLVPPDDRLQAVDIIYDLVEAAYEETKEALHGGT